MGFKKLIIFKFLDDDVYVANVGDSRAFLSEELGSKITDLSEDHKPCSELTLQIYPIISCSMV